MWVICFVEYVDIVVLMQFVGKMGGGLILLLVNEVMLVVCIECVLKIWFGELLKGE